MLLKRSATTLFSCSWRFEDPEYEVAHFIAKITSTGVTLLIPSFHQTYAFFWHGYIQTVVTSFLGKVVNEEMNTADCIDLTGNENCDSPTSQPERSRPSRKNNSRLIAQNNFEIVRLFMNCVVLYGLLLKCFVGKQQLRVLRFTVHPYVVCK